MNTAAELLREFQARASACQLNVQVPGAGNFFAEIAIIGEAPGDREVQMRMPFVGGSGQHLWSVLKKYDLTRNQVWSTNVVKRQLAFSSKEKEQIGKAELAHWEGLLDWELGQLPNLKYLLVLGNMALDAVTGRLGITNWRGSVLDTRYGTAVIAFNPAMVLREPKWEVIFAFDVAKLFRVIRGEYQKYDITYHINPSYTEAVRWIEKMQDDRLPVSFDIETIAGETACIGLANHNHEGMCINWRDRTRNVYSSAEEYDLRCRLQRLFADPRTRLVAQNGSFDCGWLWFKDRIRVGRIWVDTLLAHHLLYPSLPHNLGFLTAQYTDHPFYKDEKKSWKEGGNIDEFWEYNIKDVCITRKTSDRLLAELRAQKLDEFFFNHVMRLQPHLVEMCVLGLEMDTSLQEIIQEQLNSDVEQLLQAFWATVERATSDPDYKPNPRSPKQMAELYFNRLRLVGRGTSTDEENRKRMLAHPRTSPDARDVLLAQDKYTEEAKFLSTYAEMTVDEDGRIRSEYKQYGTQSAPGRLSSTQTLWGSGMNFQNQPNRSKPMFVADEGYCFVYFDLSQAEARVVSEIWDVAGLKENFALAATGKDVHRANAARIFRVPYDEIPDFDWFSDGKPTRRYLGKRCVHGLNYRMGPQKLADVCQIPLRQAEEAYYAYHSAFPEIKDGWDTTIDEVYATKELYTPLGRRLKFLGRLPRRNAEIGTEEAGVLDSIIAFVPQSTVGDFVSGRIYTIHEDSEWPKNEARVVLNIHDALIALVRDDPDLVQHCIRVMRRHAESPIFIKGRPLVIPAEFAVSKKVAYRVIENQDGARGLEFYNDDNGRHRWSSLQKVKLAAA